MDYTMPEDSRQKPISFWNLKKKKKAAAHKVYGKSSEKDFLNPFVTFMHSS